MAEKGRLFTGARARFSINGVRVGYARNVSITEELEYFPVEVIGNLETEEHVPIAYRVRFTASMFRIIGETLKTLGFFPEVGGNTDEHLTNVLTSGDMVATIEDGEDFRNGRTSQSCVPQLHGRRTRCRRRRSGICRN